MISIVQVLTGSAREPSITVGLLPQRRYTPNEFSNRFEVWTERLQQDRFFSLRCCLRFSRWFRRLPSMNEAN